MASLVDRCVRDREFRVATVRRSHLLFFHVYFGESVIRHETAPFQKEILDLASQATPSILAIAAFRGSAKSTICTMSLPLWAILGEPQKKFIIIVGKTQEQVKHFMGDIHAQMQENELLQRDLGPFEFLEEEPRRFSMEFTERGAKILGVTCEQSIRGLKYRTRRPDLIICDDIEDLDSVRTKEGREKTYRWLREEVIPAGDIGTRMVFVGNLVHGACLLKRIQREIAVGTLDGIYREYPIRDEEGKCIWPGKFPTEAAIEGEQKRVGDERAWEREYLLKVLPESERVIRPQWIRRYTRLGEAGEIYMYTATAIDCSFVQGDLTAIVSAKVFDKNGKLKIYILPHPVNERLTSLEAYELLKRVATRVRGDEILRFAPPPHKPHPRITPPTPEEIQKAETKRIFIEDGEYQHMMREKLSREGYDVTEVHLPDGDKRARLSYASTHLQAGHVFFPKKGCEELITQLTQYGIEERDDLADAFAVLLSRITEEGTDLVIVCFGNSDLRMEVRIPGRQLLEKKKKEEDSSDHA
jgi:hypothetical protein